MNREKRIRLGLALAKGVGPVAARRAREELGGWVAAVEAAASQSVELPPALRAGLRGAEERGGRIREDCRRRGIALVFRGDPGWPGKLACLTDEPEVLFLRGRPEILAERSVGIVGTRECSGEGAHLTRRIASRLAEEGWPVVSGLARGIDAAAHEGALAAGGETIAVLGCGPDIPYPAENARLQERVAGDGLLVSEFAAGAPPRPGNFPRRNRILAALSEAVLVVESRLRSGALVTARHALDQGKDLYAVPGWPASPLAAGPLQLLRQGARLVRHAEDLIEDLGGIPGGPAARPEEVRALEAMHRGARTARELADALGLDPEDARERLARLELLGLRPPGAASD